MKITRDEIVQALRNRGGVRVDVGGQAHEIRVLLRPDMGGDEQAVVSVDDVDLLLAAVQEPSLYGEGDFVISVPARSPDTLYFTSGDTFYTLSEHFRPSSMDYVSRCALAARLRALAELIDPASIDLQDFQSTVQP